MAETIRVARLFFVLLVVVTAGRWLMGNPPFGLYPPVPYELGHHIFSIVILTTYACLFYGAFSRRWLDYRLVQAVLLGVLMGLASQILILGLTVLSYGLGIHTYFNHPRAVMGPGTVDPVPFGRALVSRLGGLVGNSIGAGIVAALGWALGGLLPRR
jgi:hypothetical protein